MVEGLTPKDQELEAKVLGPPQQLQTLDVTQVRQLEEVAEVKVPQEVIERFERLEEEISRLRKELSELSESMKAVMVEVKEAITEGSNPFNVLREKPSSGKSGSGSQRNGKKSLSASFPNLLKTVNLLKIVYKMLDEVGKEQTMLILKGYVDVGVIDEDVGEVLIKLVELADAMRSKGLTLEKQLPHVFALFRALSTGDSVLDGYLLNELLKRDRLG